MLNFFFSLGKLCFEVIDVFWLNVQAVVFHKWLGWFFCQNLGLVWRGFNVGWTGRFFCFIKDCWAFGLRLSFHLIMWAFFWNWFGIILGVFMFLWALLRSNGLFIDLRAQFLWVSQIFLNTLRISMRYLLIWGMLKVISIWIILALLLNRFCGLIIGVIILFGFVLKNFRKVHWLAFCVGTII